MKEYSMWTSDKEVKKDLRAQAKKDAKRFCRRNKIYNTYDESVAKMIEKLYVTTYLRAFHQQSTEVKTLMSKRFPNSFKTMKTESFRFVSDKPNIVEIPRHKEEIPQSLVPQQKEEINLQPPEKEIPIQRVWIS